MLRGSRATREGNEGRPLRAVGGGRQFLPKDTTAINSPTKRGTGMMRVRGGRRHHPGCSTYQPAAVPRGVLAAGRATVVAMRERRAVVRHPAACQGHPTTASCQPYRRRTEVVTAAATVVVGGNRACLHRTPDGLDGARACPQQLSPDGRFDAHPTIIAGGGGGGGVAVLLREQLKDVKRKAREEHEYSERRISEMQGAVLVYHRRAEEAERGLKLATDGLAAEQLAADTLADILKEKIDSLATEQGRSEALKRLVDALLQERADLDAWGDEPARRGAEALSLLLPNGAAAGPPRQGDMQARWSSGLLRHIYMMQTARGTCTCRRELAANGLTHARQRFEDTVVLGQGAFGIVHRGRCKRTKKEYAIKTTKPGRAGTGLVREMMAYTMMKKHDNVIGVESLSDVAGSEGLVMEMALCDMFKACTGRSDIAFTLAQQISFEADATEGLSYMHGLGIVHCDHKLENTLICRSDGPTGFVGKVTDPGLWCGVGEMRGARAGTLGRVPLENVHCEVAAAPDHDTFAVGADLCFILAHPRLKTEDVNMWTHSSLMTAEELGRLHGLQATGGDANQLWVDVTDRTMSDGSLARVILHPVNLNPALPPSELLATCEVLKRTVSRDPTDRLEMSAMTSFLRTLAAKTAARAEKIAALQPAVGLLPPMAAAAAGFLSPVIIADPRPVIGQQQLVANENPSIVGGQDDAGPAVMGLADVPVIAACGGGRGRYLQPVIGEQQVAKQRSASRQAAGPAVIGLADVGSRGSGGGDDGGGGGGSRGGGRGGGGGDVLVPKGAIIVRVKAATPITARPIAGGYLAGPILMSPQDILGGAAAAPPAVPVCAPAPGPTPTPANVGFPQEMGGGSKAVISLVDDNTSRRGAHVAPASWSPASGLVGVTRGSSGGGDSADAPLASFAEEGRSARLPVPRVRQLVKGEEGDDKCTPSREEAVERVQLTARLIAAKNAARDPDSAGDAVPAGPAGPPVVKKAVKTGRTAVPSAAAPPSPAKQRPAGEKNVRVRMPSLEEVAGWVDLPPLPFPGSAAEALANKLDAAAAAAAAAVVAEAEAEVAALNETGGGMMGNDPVLLLLPGVFTEFEMKGLEDTMRSPGGVFGTEDVPHLVPASFLAENKQAYHDGGGGGGSRSGGGGGGGDRGGGGTDSQRERFGGGRTQKKGKVEVVEVEVVEVVAIAGGSHATPTFSQVLARGFDTDAPAASDTPTAPPAPRLRPRPAGPRPHRRHCPRPRSPPGFPGSPRARGHHPRFVDVGGAMPPALVLTPSSNLHNRKTGARRATFRRTLARKHGGGGGGGGGGER